MLWFVRSFEPPHRPILMLPRPPSQSSQTKAPQVQSSSRTFLALWPSYATGSSPINSNVSCDNRGFGYLCLSTDALCTQGYGDNSRPVKHAGVYITHQLLATQPSREEERRTDQHREDWEPAHEGGSAVVKPVLQSTSMKSVLLSSALPTQIAEHDIFTGTKMSYNLYRPYWIWLVSPRRPRRKRTKVT